MNACSMQLSEAASVLGVPYQGTDVHFKGVSTDTRSVQRGELFIALQGEHFDAHAFIAEATASGAVAIVVSRPVETGVPVLLVEDTRQALGSLASAWRDRFHIPLVAITGSNGKTTVKEMIAAILRVKGQPLVTVGNLNNDIGVPMTLLRLDVTHSHAVIEMGANHAGEIAYLASLAKPAVGVVTNAMSAHLEGFGGLDGVARAKGEMFEALSESATAVINADDHYADYWCERAKPAQVLRFGIQQSAEVSASEIEFNLADWQTCFVLQTPQGRIDIRLPLVGQHNVMNALAASAASLAVGVSLEEVRDGLLNMQNVKGRLRAQTASNGAMLIDDTYNANPSSLQAGLDVLEMMPGKRVLVLGDMGELGEEAISLHEGVAAQAREANVQFLYALGENSRYAVEAFGVGGQHFTEHDDLLQALREQLDENCVVLIKGSRLMQMERIVTGLLEEV
ncbi:UDP-N-acetylmuramoyl-tripeptide--D-alanyl-D-alanine ligase [Sulfuriflexus mobilis]|uniref:UDP-N-acetylmuramoyl-tripeptide--D-alanyl-D- alanine ligase n=1 Tax=Sulfuriflexus mobilis TaxID=1811807 RepID=UPI001E285DAD|nr:UDP-N-acetylmuramoyl-tripeptide--D-alanyl-D-alanine ligase [Sulfuriflexus mobilis]